MNKEETKNVLRTRAELRTATWTGARTYTVKLWAYLLPETSKSPTTQVRVWLQDDHGLRSQALVRPYTEPVANERSANTFMDVSSCAFEAVFDFDNHLAAATTRDKVFTAYVSVFDGQNTVESKLTHRYRWGSAGALEASSFDNGVQVVPSWTANGLQFKIAQRLAVAYSASFSGEELRLWVKCNGDFRPDFAVLQDEAERQVRASFFNREGSWIELVFNTAKLPELAAAGEESWRIHLRAGDEVRLVHWTNTPLEATRREDGLVLTIGPSGVLRLDRLQHAIEASMVDFYPLPNPHLTVCGAYSGDSSRPVGLSLDGQRCSVPAELITNEAGRFIFSIPLQKSIEPGAVVLPSGGYRFTVQFSDQSHERLRPAKSLTAGLYKAHFSGSLNIRLERSPGNEVYVDVSPPLSPRELGAFNQRKISTASRNGAALLDDHLYFESWFGKNFSDSPLALFLEARRQLPDARLYVGVADLSVPLPEGAIPVVRNSWQAWRALAEAKYVITNCWVPDNYQRHPEQVLVQTWHGTPLKLLGLDRETGSEKANRAARIERDANEWSLLVSQNPHSTDVFRRAYAYGGEILETGYPRNDALFDCYELGIQVRNSLNVPSGNTVVLYAPTWREESEGSPDLIQASELARALGPSFTVLLRGHSVSLRRGRDVEAAGVIDVTSFNDPASLMAAADVLLTDYSSIMFDFSVTKKPMVFFTPDWDLYTGSGRGVYFDLAEKAPGPLCRTRDEVVVALKDLTESQRIYQERYVAWTQEFNPWDNPKASAAVLARMFEYGSPRY
ncbi:CDP-glycerol glycerophosphotransferase family protein [Pseudarthrobacter enclensis]|uniref:CDP-glycerol glycerophosphotransferase family protein n=1 Tax=Pseudarthrobacter enclensis TaxID=993070 RepID=UPI00342E1E14